MYLKTLPDLDLAGLRDLVDEEIEFEQSSISEVQINLEDESPYIRVGEVDRPATTDGIRTIADFLRIPNAFLERLEDDERNYILQHRLERTPGVVTMAYDGGGFTGAYKPGQNPIRPALLVDIAARVTTPEARVFDWRKNAEEIHFDLYVPQDFERGVGGDPAVGDISRGGLRFGQQRARGLAPFVSEWVLRLACTNGMEVVSESGKVDARGASVEDVLAELEVKAELAFSQVEETISHFYDLRNRRVDNPERAVLRIAQERGLPNRAIRRLLDRIPTEPDFADNVTEFDVVNLITNEANSPATTQRGAQWLLQRAGGAVVSEHGERCTHCMSVLH